ncbi:MAG: restriction endonuclease subunit S [Lachnospiraceae bacterium]|nr:restriction endonuclease subunit S [Lachnospiraceae bacterium]
MENINELIKQYCPNGCEYKPLDKVCDLITGATPSKDNTMYWEDGTIPWMSSGEVNKKRIFETDTKITELGYKNASTTLVPPHTVVIALAGQGKTRGKVAVTEIELCTNQSLCSLVCHKELNYRYLYHYLDSKYYDLRAISNGDGSRGGLSLKILKPYEIPVPPLPVQEEIVRILDKFTELETELETELASELEMRKKQYEYYRDTLLVPNEKDNIVQIGDICNVITGGEPPVDCVKGNTPDAEHPYAIYGNGKEIYGYSKSYKIDSPAVTISSIGANTGAVYFRDAFFTPIIRLKVVIPKTDNVDVRYLFHALSALQIKSKSSSVPNMNASEIKDLKIVLPGLSQQRHIADILDRFDTLITDISEGLPAEIKMRHQQYEYYRDKLLTFDRLEVVNA